MSSWKSINVYLSLSLSVSLMLTLLGCADTQIEEDNLLDSKIIGGIWEANEPQAVAIRIQPSGICTGTVIAPKVVLTAAHCIAQDNGDHLAPLQIRDVSVVVNGRIQQQVGVRDAVFHAGYNGVRMSELRKGMDIALLYLDSALNVTPISLDQLNPTQRINQVGSIVGFGKTIGYDASSSGQKHSAPIQAIQYQNNLFTLRSPDRVYRSACHGDSGGPLYFGSGGQKVVAGVTSFGPDGTCTKDVFYVSVAAHLNWIMENFSGPTTGVRSKGIDSSSTQPAPPPQPSAPVGLCVQLDRCLSYCQGDEACRSNCARNSNSQTIETYNRLVNCFHYNACRDQSCAQNACGAEYSACINDEVLPSNSSSPSASQNSSSSSNSSSQTPPPRQSSSNGLNCSGIMGCFGQCSSGNQSCYQSCYNQGKAQSQNHILNVIECIEGASCQDGQCIQTYCSTELQICQYDP